MSTEEPVNTQIVRDMGDQKYEIGGVILRRGMVLYLQVGDFSYDETWLNAQPIELVVTWAGTNVATPDGYVVIEGLQRRSGVPGRPRFRCVLVPVSKLARATEPYTESGTASTIRNP